MKDSYRNSFTKHLQNWNGAHIFTKTEKMEFKVQKFGHFVGYIFMHKPLKSDSGFYLLTFIP